MNIAPGRTGGSSGDDDDTSSGGSSSSRSSPPDDIQRVDPGAPSSRTPQRDDIQRADPGAPSGGGLSGGSSSSGGSSDESSVRNRISSTIDSVRDRPGGTVAAAGLGVAAIPEPTPVTETTGLAVAGTALAAGAGIEAARQSEIGVPSRDMFSRPEVDTPTSQRRQSEVGVGTGDVTQTEIGTPTRSQRGQSEVGVPVDQSAPGEVGVPTVGATQQFGRGQQQIGQEEEEFVIGRDTIEDVEQTGELDEDEQLRQIREELERRQEFVRDVPDGGRTGGGVRFPADEAATGTAAGLGEQLEPDLEVSREGVFGSGTAAGGMTDDIVAGFEEGPQEPRGGIGAGVAGGIAREGVLGTGIDPTASEPGTTTEPTTEPVTTTDVSTDSGLGGGTGTGEGTATMVEESVMVGTQQVDAISDQFAEPEQTAFERTAIEPAQVDVGGGQVGPRARRPRRLPEFDEGAGAIDVGIGSLDTEDVVEPTRGLDAVDDDIMRGFDVP